MFILHFGIVAWARLGWVRFSLDRFNGNYFTEVHPVLFTQEFQNAEVISALHVVLMSIFMGNLKFCCYYCQKAESGNQWFLLEVNNAIAQKH